MRARLLASLFHNALTKTDYMLMLNTNLRISSALPDKTGIWKCTIHSVKVQRMCQLPRL